MALGLAAYSVTTYTSNVLAQATVVSPAFSPAAGDVIYCVGFVDGPVTGAITENAPTNSGTALTWHFIVRENSFASGSINGSLFVYWAFNASAQTSITVTVNSPNATALLKGVAVIGFTGADSAQTGAVSVATEYTAATTTPTSSNLTTSAAGSWIWMAGWDWTAFRSTMAPASGQSAQIAAMDASSNGDTEWLQKENPQPASNRAAGTVVTMSDTGSTASDFIHLVAWEVVPAAVTAVTWVPQRYGQAAPPSPAPWSQRDRRDANTVATAANPLVSPLDSAWQADAAYWHLYGDSALRDRRQYFQQRALVSDPNLLAGAALDPTQNAQQDLARRYALPATHADRREVPAQHDLRDANTVATAANPLIPPLDSAWQAGGHYWHLYNQAGDITDRRQYPQQKDMRDANTVGTPGGVTDPVLSAAEDLRRRYSLPATHSDRRQAGQQRPYISDPSFYPSAPAATGVGSGTTEAWWGADPAPWQIGQRAYVSDPSFYPAAVLTDPATSGGLERWLNANLAATHADRRLVPQQRAYYGPPAVVVQFRFGSDFVPGNARPGFATPGDPVTLAFNPATGGQDYLGRQWRQAATHAARWWMPQQRAYLSDPSFYPPQNNLDPLLAGQDYLDLHQHQAATHWDRRLVPQQRPYVSDPSFYTAVPPADPLTLAWGAGGPYWHLYNRAGDITDRRLVPQQRNYVSDPLLLTTAELENVLLGGGETGKYYRTPASHYARWWMPEQRAYVSDPLLLTTALLENEMLGGAGTAMRYLQPATHYDRREIPAQPPRPALQVPVVPLDPVQSAWAVLWLAYNLAATHYDRRLYPQQRLYFPVPLPPPPFIIGALTASSAPLAVLTATTAPGGTSGGILTATDKRTGGPS